MCLLEVAFDLNRFMFILGNKGRCRRAEFKFYWKTADFSQLNVGKHSHNQNSLIILSIIT